MASREGSQMHAVMLAMPVPGHINPMLHLSFKLASRGFKITFVNTEYNRSRMLPLSPGDQDNISFVYIPDGLPPEHGRATGVVELLVSLDTVYARYFEELLERLVLQDPPVMCIIANTFISKVQESVKKLGLPFVSFWTQSAASYASLLMVAKGYRPPKGSQPSDVITCRLPGVPPLKFEEMNGFVQCYDTDDFMFKLFVRPFETIGQADCILMNTCEELEEETMASLKREHPVLAVGPLLPASFFKETDSSVDTAVWVGEDERCLSWLDEQEKGAVIYVSFGSLAVMTAEQIAEIALGLEASQQPFLWVVRLGLMAGGKSAELPEGFLERTKARGLIISWAPQLKVLRHKAVGGFFTHCGWNSTLEGISAGVPLLGWSSMSDQAMNCRCAVDSWKVGLRLERGSGGVVDHKEVEKKVIELMQGENGKALRARAREWRQATVKAAAHEEGSTLKNIQVFIDNIGAIGRSA